jgi:uncharacterized ion transporter superfamily protein YfcC
MKSPKRINYFANEVKEDNTQPQNTDTKRQKKGDVVDGEAKAKTRNTIIKWVILVLVLAGIGVLIYFSCFAGNAKKISPTNVTSNSATEMDVQATESGKPFIVANIQGEGPNSDQM